jgi:hypothetical protein
MGEISLATKEELSRQIVIFIFSTIGVVVSLFLVQALSDPDLVRTYRMRMALKAKHVFQDGADLLQEYADKSATFYNREKA